MNINPIFEDSDFSTIEIISDGNSFSKASFERIIREVASTFGDYHFEKEALDILQQVTEEHLISLFDNANACSKNAGRKTITIEDFKLVSNIQK